MGMFKGLRDLQKQSKELQKNMDVGATMANAQAQMAGAQEMMAQQTKAANAATNGVEATAVVVAVRQSGAMINMQPSMEIDLNVMPEGLPPYPVTVSQIVAPMHLAAFTVGKSLHVKVDPNDPSAVWIDLTKLS
jgi:hypothetical protein